MQSCCVAVEKIDYFGSPPKTDYRVGEYSSCSRPFNVIYYLKLNKNYYSWEGHLDIAFNTKDTNEEPQRQAKR